MHRTRTILAVVLVATGLVWIGQGLGLLRGASFMVDDTRWALVGAACVAGGLWLGLVVTRGRRPPG